MELTREEIEYLATGEMTLNEMRRERGGIPKKNQTRIKQLAKQLLVEMDNPKVWDGAPDNAIIAKVHFYKRDKVYARPDGTPEVYTRELPKSRIDEIAEAAMKLYIPNDDSKLTAIIKGAILAYAEESK